MFLAKDCSMSWDAEYQVYSDKKTPEACQKWRSVKAKASSDYLCSGLPFAYYSFLKSVLSLAPEAAPDYDSYVDIFKSMFESEQSVHSIL